MATCTVRLFSAELPMRERSSKSRLGGTETVLHIFCTQSGCPDGAEPQAGLVQGSDGNFYGTTSMGGALGLGGTIFKITPSGTLTTLHNFCSQSGCADGEQPVAGLLQASDGNFYGTTEGGGAHIFGTLFAITPGGDFSSLYSFCSLGGTSCADGASATPD